MKIVYAVLSIILMFQPVFAMQSGRNEQTRKEVLDQLLAIGYITSQQRSQQPDRQVDTATPDKHSIELRQLKEENESLKRKNNSLERKNRCLKCSMYSFSCIGIIISCIIIGLSIANIVNNNSSNAPGNFTG